MTKTIAILYLLFGLFLARIIPELNASHAERFGNWNTSDSLLVRAFHVPGYIWFIPFAAACTALLLVSPRLQERNSKILNIGSLILLIILVIHYFDLFSMFIFCHEWGCSGGLLPTWNLLR